MRISTMAMFGGQSFATEITIHDSPGRDYVITADPTGDKPAANPAPQGKQKPR